MKQICHLTFTLMLLSAAVGLAQSTGSKAFRQASSPQLVYDRFDRKWIDPSKWAPDTPTCYGTLECVREIQNGQLRLAARNFGSTDSDSGTQWAGPILWFQNPTFVTGIQADITVRSFSGTACSTNETIPSGQAQIGGTFFNTGTGDADGDVFAVLYIYIDTSTPQTLSVNGWWGYKDQGQNQPIAQFPMGTPLTGSFMWDKANHQFIAGVKVTGDTGSGTVITMPYPMSDATPPVYPDKRLVGVALSPNCTSGKTNAAIETRFDNVITNR